MPLAAKGHAWPSGCGSSLQHPVACRAALRPPTVGPSQHVVRLLVRDEGLDRVDLGRHGTVQGQRTRNFSVTEIDCQSLVGQLYTV